MKQGGSQYQNQTHHRRRSADIGGLFLATENQGKNGQGWVGSDEIVQTKWAEQLGEMYEEYVQIVNEPVEIDYEQPSKETRERLIHLLDSWEFDPLSLTTQEVMTCTVLLFEALFRVEGLEDAVDISLDQIIRTAHHLRKIYRLENPYHNFEHALDVLHASQAYLRSAGVVPPPTVLLEDGKMWRSERVPNSDMMTCLELEDLFTIYVAAIGHDVGHPGFTNLFMKSTAAPLSLMYNGESTLERMHYQLLTLIMRRNGLGRLFDHPVKGKLSRKLLQESILATDMGVHKDFMEEFQTALKTNGEPRSGRTDSTTDSEGCCMKSLMARAILKCADISNPSRPFEVAKSWATALQTEWHSQRAYEDYLGVDPTMKNYDTPLSEAECQVFFSKLFAMPLLEVMVDAVPECHKFLSQCRENLERWTERMIELRAPTTNGSSPPPSDLCPYDSSFKVTSRRRPEPEDFLTAFPLALPPSQRTPQHEKTLSWSTDDDSPGDSWISSPVFVRANSVRTPSTDDETGLSDERDDASSSADSFVTAFSSVPIPFPHHYARSPPRSRNDSGNSTGNSGPPPVTPPVAPIPIHLSMSYGGGALAIRAAGVAAANGVKLRKMRSANRNSWSHSLSASPSVLDKPLPAVPNVNGTGGPKLKLRMNGVAMTKEEFRTPESSPSPGVYVPASIATVNGTGLNGSQGQIGKERSGMVGTPPPPGLVDKSEDDDSCGPDNLAAVKGTVNGVDTAAS